MNRNENIIFLIHTEFHLLMISGFVRQYYSVGYNISIVVAKSKNDKRFGIDLDFSPLNAKVYWVPIKEDNYKRSKEFYELIEEICAVNYIEYISFLEHSPLNYLFVGLMKSQGTKICLAPEGTKPYIKIAKLALPSRLRATLNNYRFLLGQGFFPKIFKLVSNTHGYLSETDEVWIDYPETYKNKNEKLLRKVEILKSYASIEQANAVFKFDSSEKLSQINGVIFYLNHWFVVKEIYDYEIKILTNLSIKFPDNSIYIKLHPNTPDFQIDRFKTIPCVKINTSTIPAELFILSLQKSIVMSFWSASLLVENESCNAYWLNKMMAVENPSMDWWSICNPTKHIQEIHSLEEIVFPIT